MTTKIRAISTIKLQGDSCGNSTWEFRKGQPLISVLRDLILFNPIDVDEARKVLNEALDSIDPKQDA